MSGGPQALPDVHTVLLAVATAGCGGTAATQQRGGGSIALAALSGGQPDDEKSAEELRAELGQLRQAMALQGDEAQKVCSCAAVCLLPCLPVASLLPDVGSTRY